MITIKNPPTLPAERRVRVHFVYHLLEVIARRSALLVQSRTGKCQVGGGGPGGTTGGLLNQGLARVRRFSNVFPISGSRIRQSRNNKQCLGQEYVNLATISNVPKTKYMTLGPKFFCCSKMTITRRRKHLNQ